MTDQNIKRRSHCSICGKRLSLKTSDGDVQWQSSLIDEKGIYCNSCYTSKDKTSKKKMTPRA